MDDITLYIIILQFKLLSKTIVLHVIECMHTFDQAQTSACMCCQPFNIYLHD